MVFMEALALFSPLNSHLNKIVLLRESDLGRSVEIV